MTNIIEGIYTIKEVEMAMRHYDILSSGEARAIKIDLDLAMKYSGLTQEELVSLHLIFGLELTYVEAHTVFGKELGINMITIKRSIDEALEKLTAYMTGKPMNNTPNKINPLTTTQKEREKVARALQAHDELFKEMVAQIDNPSRREEIMSLTSDNEYTYHETSSAIENPNRTFDYKNRLNGGKDYFMEQFVRNNLALVDGMY